MKKILLIVTMTTILTGCTGKEKINKLRVLEQNRYFVHDTFKPYTGKLVIHYTGSKEVKHLFSYVEGKLDGETVWYYPNGHLKVKGNYRHGEFDGKWEKFYANGNKSMEVIYNNGVLEGPFTRWYKNGRPMEVGLYANSILVGTWTTWDESGKKTHHSYQLLK